MSKVVSIRLKDEQFERLKRAARRQGRTASESAARILDEALRQNEFVWVEFRDSASGRQAYLKGTRLPIWQVAWIAHDYANDVAKTAEHFDLTEYQILAALSYATAYPDEIEQAIADNHPTLEELKRLLPWLEVATFQDDEAPS